MPEREFIRKLEADYPEQHVESRRSLRLQPTKSASIMIDKAIKLAMEIEGLKTREQVLELWASEYILAHQSEDVA